MDIKDIELEDDGDFKITETGDLKIVEGERAINESLYRRIKTPVLGYQRWVRYLNGLFLLDGDYGNPLFNYLSSPITNATVEKIREGVESAVVRERRIQLTKLSIQPKASQSKIDIQIEYIIKGESEIRSLNYTLTTES